jgi:cytochrome c-type biogenesis protein CcmH
MLILLLLASFTAQVRASDVLSFTSEKEALRFHTFVREIRCVVCQNQSIAESNAPLANDLRKKIHEQIQAGKTNQEIKDYLVARYGEFILFSPPLNKRTLLLWLLPALLLILGLLAIRRVLCYSVSNKLG